MNLPVLNDTDGKARISFTAMDASTMRTQPGPDSSSVGTAGGAGVSTGAAALQRYPVLAQDLLLRYPGIRSAYCQPKQAST